MGWEIDITIIEESIILSAKINQFLDNKMYVEAFKELEKQKIDYSGNNINDLFLLAETAGSYITLGSESYNLDIVNKGIKLFEDYKDVLKIHVTEDSINYCLANGYHARHKILTRNNPNYFPKPENVKENLFKAKQFYFKAFKKINLEILDNYSIKILTNLGNTLLDSGRIVEALQLFDLVLKYNSNFPQAIVSKAEGLVYMIRTSKCSLTISLFVEIYGLYYRASKFSIVLEDIKKTIEEGLKQSAEVLKLNNYDISNIEKDLELNINDYQNHFLETKFYLDNFLSLSEHSLFCKCNESKIDNLMIGYSGYIAINKKIPQLELLLNRIKSEFSLSRKLYYEYLSSNNDDNIYYEDVLKGIKNGIHYEKIRTSFRLCFGILDKIAEGICYLLELNTNPNEKIYFEAFWNNPQGQKDKWIKINSINNVHITALFSIACDLNSKSGEFGFYKQWRNALEHSVFSITDSNDVKLNSIEEVKFTQHATEEDFKNKTKYLLQLTRSAIFSFVYCTREELINERIT